MEWVDGFGVVGNVRNEIDYRRETGWSTFDERREAKAMVEMDVESGV